MNNLLTKQLKKVSIITVAYNRETTILKCIESVNNQTYPYIEHILIDGNSLDKTVKIFKDKSERENIIISEADSGIYNAMNKGLQLASGDIIGFLNGDDELYNDLVIEDIVQLFDSEKDCVYGNLIFVNSNNKVVRKWRSRKFKSGLFQYSWTPAHPTFYCKKHIYDDLGNYREDFKIASDVDLMFRFLEINQIKSFHLDQTLVKMSLGGISTKSLKSTWIITKEVFQSFEEHGYNYNKLIYLVSKILKAIRQLK